MIRKIVGEIRGESIWLNDTPGLPDGTRVVVEIQPEDSALTEAMRASAVAAITESAGGWREAAADDFDRWLEWTMQSRGRVEPDPFLIVDPRG